MKFKNAKLPHVHYIRHTVHGFHKSSYNVTEGLRLDTTFGPNVKGVSRFELPSLPGIISVVENTASKLWFLKCTILLY